ncbi:MAG: tail completion protein gp17 [Gammaproteobacteria bacterium]
MSAESDIYDDLSGAAAVTALVSTRIYPDVRPQDDALPAIVYLRESTEPINTISGSVIGAEVTLAVICIAETRTAAEAVADAAQTALATTGGRPIVDRASDYEDGLDVFSTTIRVVHQS